MSEPRNELAVVTGGSAGIGRAVVERLIGRGYKVGVLARGEDRLREMEDEFGVTWVHGVSCDVADAAATEAATQQIVRWAGAAPLKVWVNSAMLTAFAPFRSLSAAAFEQIVGATFFGQVNGARAALKHMTEGNLVCIGSGLGYRAVPLQSAYVSAKHATNGFASALRSELMHEERPIEVSLVQLPAVNTPQFDWAAHETEAHPQPAPPIYEPDVAARAVMKAIDGNHREIIVGRAGLQLIFGDMIAPGLLDRVLSEKGYDVQTNDDDRAHPDPAPNLWGPAAYPSRARGSFGHRAASSGIAIDGDMARLVAFAAPVVLALAAGAGAVALTKR